MDQEGTRGQEANPLSQVKGDDVEGDVDHDVDDNVKVDVGSNVDGDVDGDMYSDVDGDVDGNGSTDFGDILAVLSEWGVCSEG